MHVTRAISALFIAVIAFAQGPPGQTPEQVAASLEQYQTVDGLSRLARTLGEKANVSETVKAEAEKLRTEATTYLGAGDNGEARRRLMHSLALLRGMKWNEREQYVGSLTLRTDMIAADSSVPFVARLTQSYPAQYEASSGLQLRVWLSSEVPSSSGSPNTAAAAAKATRQIGVYPLYSRDLIDQPFRFDASLDGMADGLYQVAAEVLDGNLSIGKVGSIRVYLVRGMQSERAAIEQKLAVIQGHESTKATIRYPFDLARAINLERRELANFDFAKEIRYSTELMQALESGSDPLWRAKGDHKRHYVFTEADEIMPYRVYVPDKWDGRSKLPLMMMLHGGGGNEDGYMDRNDRQVPKLAEQHGYIVVSPLGYRPSGAYGNPMMLPAVFGNATREGRAVGDARRKRMLELSEKDVMNVIELVASEYEVDGSRIYLAGHSMGSGGTWHLGAKYAERWAAIAPLSGPFVYENYPFDRIKNMPVFYTEGLQAPASLEGSRVLAKYMKENGFDFVYEEVDGTHGSMVAMVMPRVFAFFDKHSKR
jgi:poly(3-hydroxybutyrate) depolymerase